MPIGPGKYDHLCTSVREGSNAEGVIVIVIGGDQGSGFSCQATAEVTADLPHILEEMAEKIKNLQD